MIDSKIIQQAVDIIIREADPTRIILFGSHARGDARPDSDIDLLVVEPSETTCVAARRKHASSLYRALARVPVDVDLVIATTDEVSFWRPARNHVVARALREGKVVYDRA